MSGIPEATLGILTMEERAGLDRFGALEEGPHVLAVQGGRKRGGRLPEH
jgi:hypothetical protein